MGSSFVRVKSGAQPATGLVRSSYRNRTFVLYQDTLATVQTAIDALCGTAGVFDVTVDALSVDSSGDLVVVVSYWTEKASG